MNESYRIGDVIYMATKGGGLFQIRDVTTKGLALVRRSSEDYRWAKDIADTEEEIKMLLGWTDKEYFLDKNMINNYINNKQMFKVKTEKQFHILEKLYA